MAGSGEAACCGGRSQGLHCLATIILAPHRIGGDGDHGWEQGSFTGPHASGLETWFIRGISAGAATYAFRQTAVYNCLTHNLIEAVELGALAPVVVEG